MAKTVKQLKVQYKNWSCYQTLCTKSGSGCIQRIVSDDLKTQIDFTDSAIVRTTKRQLYRYLKWFVDNKKYEDSFTLANASHITDSIDLLVEHILGEVI
ncbi:MAG: hypothetical protein IJJ00_04480 [Erysipelotrichaceae bacterium]|nr:hypothetical protein [Erysipelotrichaceae bacterium]